MATPRIRIGQLLVDAKILSPEQLDQVLEQQKSDGRRLGTLLVESGFVTEMQVTQILSQQLSVPWVSLYHIDFSRQLLNLVPRQVAEKYGLVPIYVRHVRKQGDTLYVAMDDPTNEAALAECSQWSSLPVRAMIAAPSDIRNAIRVYYGGGKPSMLPAPASKPEPAPASAPPPASRPPKPPPPVRVEERAPAPSDPPVSLKEADFVASTPPPGTAQPTVAGPEPASSGLAHSAPAEMPPVAASAPVPDSTAPKPPSERAPSRPSDEGPEVEVREIELPRRAKGKGPRMIALTFLDGTTINLPAARKRDAKSTATSEPPAPAARESPAPSDRPPDSTDDQLTARDLVAALRAVSHGADPAQILGTEVKWEKMFAALLSVLLRKHLIADWEFVDELKKM